MVKVDLKHGDVTSADADVLVNASNTSAWLGSGVSGAIRAACGVGFQALISAEVVRRFGAESMDPAEVLITTAGSHPRARYVAHVAVMDYRPGHQAEARPTEARIRSGCMNLWRALEELPLEGVSVAMVALGAGAGGLGVRTPTEIACTTLAEHLNAAESRIRRIVFFGFELHDFANIVHVVQKHFPIDESQIPAEVLSFVRGIS